MVLSINSVDLVFKANLDPQVQISDQSWAWEAIVMGEDPELSSEQ